MACNPLTEGILKGCDNNYGGITELYLTEKSNVDTVTRTSPGNQISAITMIPGKVFYKFEFNKNTSTFTEVTTSDQGVGSEVCTQTISLILNRREQDKRDTLLLLGKFKELAAIVKDSNKKYWYPGEENGMLLTEKNSESGTAKTDRNGYTLTIVGEEDEDACEVEESAVLAVIG
jgi:hypothetical protein